MSRTRLLKALALGALLWLASFLVVAALPDCPTVYRWYHMSPEWRWWLQAEVERCEGAQ